MDSKLWKKYFNKNKLILFYNSETDFNFKRHNPVQLKSSETRETSLGLRAWNFNAFLCKNNPLAVSASLLFLYAFDNAANPDVYAAKKLW